MVAVNAGHLLLEIQEAATDALFGTHNVHGILDTVSDLAAGLIMTVVTWRLVARRWVPPPTPRADAVGGTSGLRTEGSGVG